MKIVILAGGKGTRMGSLTGTVPKPMLPVAGKPLLEYQLELAARYGFTEVIILGGHLGDVIGDHFGDGGRWGVTLRHVVEEVPRGTAGAVRGIAHELDDDFLVTYGDVMMDVDLPALVACHRRGGAAATLAVHPNDHPEDSDLLEVDDADRVVAVHPKPHPPGAWRRNLVNAALYVLSPRVLELVPDDRPSDFGRDIFPAMIRSGLPIMACRTTEYIKDVGTPGRIEEVARDVASGRVARGNRRHARRAVFLDRDGVLNRERGMLVAVDELELLPGVAESVRRLNRSEFLAVVATNQPQIAKGMLSEEGLEAIHAKLDTLLGRSGAYLDRIYHCPHHPERGFPGERVEYKIACSCRKPGTGMIDRAVAELNIERHGSFLVGDRTVDIKAGQDAGLATVLVRTGFAGGDGTCDVEPDFVFADLPQAVSFILERHDPLTARVDELLGSFDPASGRRPMVVVAGLARSGKSTTAAIVAAALRRRGFAPVLLRLDDWLVDIGRREEWMTVRQRYRYDRIRRDINALLEGRPVTLDRYDPRTREVAAGCRRVALAPGGALIVEGVVGLDVDVLRERSDLRIFVEVPEEIRRRRFEEYYRFKGLEEEAIAALYERRQEDESEIVLASSRHADITLNPEAVP